MRTTIAGTIDYLWHDGDTAMDITCAPACSPPRRRSPMAGIGTPGDFPGPLFAALPPVEIGVADRGASSTTPPTPAIGDAYDRMIAVAARSERRLRASSASLLRLSSPRGIAERFGTRGAPISLTTACASGATAIQLGVEAIRRGDTDAALCDRRRLLGQPRDGDPLLAALGAVRHQRAAGGGVASPSRRTATASSSPRARRRWCWRTTTRRRRAARRSSPSSAASAEKADDFHRTRSKPDGSAIIGAIRNTIDDAGIAPGRDRLHQRPRHRHAGERQDGGDVARGRVRRAHPRACRSARTSR